MAEDGAAGGLRKHLAVPRALLNCWLSYTVPTPRAAPRPRSLGRRAAFTFNALPFKVPYPVPFRLLGDEAKGWIDVTYLSPDGTLRLTRGNKVGCAPPLGAAGRRRPALRCALGQAAPGAVPCAAALAST